MFNELFHFRTEKSFEKQGDYNVSKLIAHLNSNTVNLKVFKINQCQKI